MSSSNVRSGRRKPRSWAQWQQRLRLNSSLQTEDSVALRVLVQVLVTIGILSVSVAAAGVSANSTLLNLLAIPASIIGATWSWYRRRHSNIAVKFCIAIGMLVALGAFLSRMVGEPGDTRILLAELLIHLQVLHSFDIPRRKDLGYSMVIGLILIGVAATVSQTLSFAPLLLLFLAIALPVLVLDYRSRLGLLAQGWSPLKTGFDPRRLALVLGITLGLGLLIFALLPRLPGYQLRSFPVSSNIEFQGEFDSSSIVNPGYERGNNGTGLDEDSTGEGGSGPGQLDERSYYGFNQRINQNLRGQLKPEVVMRVRSQAEGFWRVLAFDRYNGQGWEISRNTDAAKVRRSSWSFRFFLPRTPKLGRQQEVIQTYTVVTDVMPNLIPALYEPEDLYFPTQEIAIDSEGGLRSPINLSEGLTYTVVSEVPARDRTQLAEAGTNYPQEIREVYLQLPEGISPQIRQRAEELLAESEKPITQPYEQALYLAQALKQRYEIQPDLPFLEDGEDLAEAFLFKYQGGYPDHFSTTLTVMLRSLGIPARLVAGFGPGEFNPFTGFYVVKNTDAYAMTEVYFPGYGWFAFNPIPGYDLIPPSFEDYEAFSVIRQFWRWVASWLPSPVTGFFGRVISSIGAILTWFIQLFSRGWVGILAGLALLTGAGFLGWLAWESWKTWRRRRWLAKLHPMEGLYQQMLRSLAEEGFPKPAAQTPLEYARWAQTRISPERASLIQEISDIYLHWRYGGYQPDLNYVREQLRKLQQHRRVRVKVPSKV